MVNAYVDLAGERLEARPTGTLWWPAERVLAAGDLHLGRAAAAARRGESFLPPYGDQDTLDRLAAEVRLTGARRVVLVGDSFDDTLSADEAAAAVAEALQVLAAGRDLIWIAGNHDPRPVHALPGRWASSLRVGPLVFRHIAASAAPQPGGAEVSAHYHPRATLVGRRGAVTRRCFLVSGDRLILPAFGTYTGGLDALDSAFDALMDDAASVLMTGRRVVSVPRLHLAKGLRSAPP
ncbi:MAG: ligase-associated DNA damage response endonuclease PdeM, partial [Pseudomonadota bacterium]